MKYVVFDSYALAYKAYYGFPPLTNNKGRATAVTVGFFKIILSIIHKYNLEDACMVFMFDSKGPTFRKEMEPTYKANRSKKEDSFYLQIDEIKTICAKLWTVYEQTGYEADDLAGSFINKYVKQEDTCIMVTVDKDWLQLLKPNVSAILLSTTTNAKIIKDTDFFAENDGILPISIIDLKALMGDGSDNIPGVKGIGWVTAQKLIKEFGTIENIYNNILKVTNKGKLQSKLIENEKRVKLNKKLVTIVSTLDLPAPNMSFDIDNACSVLSYLEDELNAEDLSNQMGLLFQVIKERRVA